MRRAYKVVDVFTARPLLGNPVAVILDAEGLDLAAMQAIARWTNLSETTFVSPGGTGADYHLRIFTPRTELPFAGHPTLGSAHAVLESGRVVPRDGRLVQRCGVGLVNIAAEGEGPQRRLSFELPPAKVTTLAPADVEELEACIGDDVLSAVAPAVVNVGAVWIVAQVTSVQRLLALQPDLPRCAALERRLAANGVSLFAQHSHGEPAIEVRSFAPSCGVDEDPVCGSGNGSIAVFRNERGLLPAGRVHYVARQGQCVGRDGRVAVTVNALGVVSLGGACVTCVDGVLNI